MCAVIDGLSFDSLMDMPLDLFSEVRDHVSQITKERQQAQKKYSRHA